MTTAPINFSPSENGLGWRTEVPADAARQAAQAVANVLGWDAARIDEEVAGYVRYVREQHLQG